MRTDLNSFEEEVKWFEGFVGDDDAAGGQGGAKLTGSFMTRHAAPLKPPSEAVWEPADKHGTRIGYRQTEDNRVQRKRE